MEVGGVISPQLYFYLSPHTNLYMSLHGRVILMDCPMCKDGGMVVNSGGCHTCMNCSWSACPSG